MRSLDDLRSLRDAIEQGVGIDYVLVYRRPVVLSLLGDHAAARAAIEDQLAEIGHREDLAAQHFRRFAAAFHDRESELSTTRER